MKLCKEKSCIDFANPHSILNYIADQHGNKFTIKLSVQDHVFRLAVFSCYSSQKFYYRLEIKSTLVDEENKVMRVYAEKILI